MSGLSCSNPNSCHPFLLTFGIITVFLMAIYVIRDTFLDNARPKRGPILSTFNVTKSRQPPVRQEPAPGPEAVKFTNEETDGFKALRYEDTRYVNVGNSEQGNGQGSSKGPMSSTLDTEKLRQPPVHKESDLDLGSADVADENPKDEDKWYGNVEHFEYGDGGRKFKDPVLSTISDEKPKHSDFDSRPADFGDERSDDLKPVFDPYTWHHGERRSQEQV